MKPSERRLLMIFVALAFVLGSVLLGQYLRRWQHSIERKERDAELAQMESTILLEQAPQWMAKRAWLTQVQPVANSEAEANEGLFNSLSHTAEAAGLKAVKVQVERTEENPNYRQYGVSLTLKGDYSKIMRWIHERLAGPFYVMPLLHITPDPQEPNEVLAQMRIVRWYAPQFAAQPSEAPAS